MAVLVAYLTVIIIWSTTALGIVWSSESVNPQMGGLLRILIAASVGWLIIKWAKIPLPHNGKALRIYAYSSLNIFVALSFCYVAAQQLPSSILALVFGLSPLLSGLLAQKLLKEVGFGWLRTLALAISVTGLAIVFADNIALNINSKLSLVMALMAVFCFSLSTVLIKSVDITIHPLSTTVGSLIFCVPLYAISWYIFDGTLPFEQWQPRSLWAIAYLGLIGSLLGFVAFYYILQRLPASTVSLVTLVTPIIALFLGHFVNDEPVSLQLIVGAICVISGLALYPFGDTLIRRSVAFTHQ